MTANAAQSNALFDSMLDALLRDEMHEFGAATRPEFARETLKLMEKSLRLGQPSSRMMKLLADHLKRIKPEQAIAILGTTKTGLGFREQDACNTYENLLLDHDELTARIGAYNAYFRDTGRTYAKDLLDKSRVKDDALFSNRAESAMPSVVELLRKGRVIKRNPRGRPRGKNQE